MYNRVILMGRLTKDPELRTAQNGKTLCWFSMAVDKIYSKTGADKQTDFFDVSCFGQTAEFVAKYFRKGKLIHLEGSLRNNNYTDNSGVKHYGMSVIADRVTFCGDKDNPGQSNYRAVQQAPQRMNQPCPPPAYPEPYPPTNDNGYYTQPTENGYY